MFCKLRSSWADGRENTSDDKTVTIFVNIVSAQNYFATLSSIITRKKKLLCTGISHGSGYLSKFWLQVEGT